MKRASLAAIALVAGCAGQPTEVPGYEGLVDRVENNQVGRSRDEWVEMKNLAGEWERTALVFGYSDDFEECIKVIAGLKEFNPARDYRCTTAN